MRRGNPLQRVFADRQGSILVGVLVLILVLTIIGMVLYQSSVIESQQISKTETDMRAFYAADAGIHRAALDLADPPSAGVAIGALAFDAVKAALPSDNTTLWPSGGLTGFSSTCFGGNTCDSSVKPYKPAYLVQARNITGDENRFWLVSTACTPGPAANPCPAGSKMAQIQAQIVKNVVTGPPGPPGPPPPVNVFKWGAFGGGSLKINGGTVDSYNSHKAGCTVPCPYGGANVGSNGDVGSNGSIDLTGSTTILGDITNTTNVPADTSDINIGTSVTVQGNVQTGGTAVIGGVTDPNGQSGGNGTGTSSQVTGTVTHDTGTSQVAMDPLPNCGAPSAPFSDLTGKITQYPFNPDKTCNWTATPIAATWKYGGTTGCGSCGTSTGAFVANNICIAIAPGSYCLGQVTVTGGDAGILVTDRTILTIDGTFTSTGGNGIENASQLPQNLQIISTYGNDAGETSLGVSMTGGDRGTWATIYAPTTNMKITGGNPQFYGGIMAKNLDLGSTKLHFDEYLASGEAGLEHGTPGTPPQPWAIFTLASWKRVECGPTTFPC